MSRRVTRSSQVGNESLPTPEPSSQPPVQTLHSSGDEEEDEDDIIVPSSKRRKTTQDVGAEGTPTRRSGRMSRENAGRRQTRGTPVLRVDDDLGSPETSGDDELALISKPTQKRRSRVPPKDPFIDDDEPITLTERTLPVDDFIAGDDEVEYISSDEDIKPTMKKKRNRHRSRNEQNELDEDLDDLRTSDVEETLNRTRGGIVNKRRDNAREHLEILKRRRAGERIPRVEDSSEEDAAYDSNDDGVDIDNIGTIPSELNVEQHQSETEYDEVRRHYELELDMEEDDFVVDDEDDAEARTQYESLLPIELTIHATKKPKDLFINVVDWLVKNKIAPAFDRKKDIYQLAWNKISDQIKAQAGSRLISSAWNADFVRTVLARPAMEINHMGTGIDSGFMDCDACNRSNHPATIEFKFTGHAYHPNTLEPLKDDDDDDDDDEEEQEVEDEEVDDDNASYDHQGKQLQSISTTFLLGAFCASNAEMGHKLTHWKFHLNQALLAYLDSQGVLSPDQIVARDRKSQKKRETEAEDVVEIMEQTGIIAEMWRDLQNDLEDARLGMEDHVSKKGRSKGRIGKVRTDRRNGTIEEWGENGRIRISRANESDED